MPCGTARRIERMRLADADGRRFGQHAARRLVARLRHAVEAGRQMQQRHLAKRRIAARPAAGRAHSGSGNCLCRSGISGPLRVSASGVRACKQPAVELGRRDRADDAFLRAKRSRPMQAARRWRGRPSRSLERHRRLVRMSPPRSRISASKASSSLPAPPLTIGAPAASSAKAMTLAIWPEKASSGPSPACSDPGRPQSAGTSSDWYDAFQPAARRQQRLAEECGQPARAAPPGFAGEQLQRRVAPQAAAEQAEQQAGIALDVADIASHRRRRHRSRRH